MGCVNGRMTASISGEKKIPTQLDLIQTSGVPFRFGL